VSVTSITWTETRQDAKTVAIRSPSRKSRVFRVLKKSLYFVPGTGISFGVRGLDLSGGRVTSRVVASCIETLWSAAVASAPIVAGLSRVRQPDHQVRREHASCNH